MNYVESHEMWTGDEQPNKNTIYPHLQSTLYITVCPLDRKLNACKINNTKHQSDKHCVKQSIHSNASQCPSAVIHLIVHIYKQAGILTFSWQCVTNNIYFPSTDRKQIQNPAANFLNTLSSLMQQLF